MTPSDDPFGIPGLRDYRFPIIIPSIPYSYWKPGQRIEEGGSITSPNGIYSLIFQNDGNLVLYKNGGAIWALGTNNYGLFRKYIPNVAEMQNDGNFVLYRETKVIRLGIPPWKIRKRAAWATETSGNYGAYLSLNDNGDVALVHDRKILWNPHLEVSQFYFKLLSGLGAYGSEVCAKCSEAINKAAVEGGLAGAGAGAAVGPVGGIGGGALGGITLGAACAAFSAECRQCFQEKCKELRDFIARDPANPSLKAMSDATQEIIKENNNLETYEKLKNIA